MVLPTEFTIKQEKDDYEQNSSENSIPDSCLDSKYDVTVKIETAGTECFIKTDYEVKTEIHSEFESYSDASDKNGVSYEELLDYCEQRCSVCHEKFWESYSLLRHNLTHLKLQLEPVDQMNRCKICLQYFTNKKALIRHVNEHESNGYCVKNENFKVTDMLHQCKLCGTIKKYKHWHAHMQEVHSDKQCICDTCNRVFKCRQYLRKHERKVHQNKKREKEKGNKSIPNPCSLCPAVLQCKNALKTHIRNCHSEKVQCNLCKSVLKCKSYLLSHMKRVHYDDGKEHTCDCGKSFRSPRYLKVHMKNAHGGDNNKNVYKFNKKYKCECGKSYSTVSSLNVHMKNAHSK